MRASRPRFPLAAGTTTICWQITQLGWDTVRHDAATLLLAAGHDMKVAQDTRACPPLGSPADTYTSVPGQLAR